MHQDWPGPLSKALPGSVTWGTWPLLWGDCLEVHWATFSQKTLHVPYPTLTAFSGPLEILVKYILLLLSWDSNAEVIVAPRGLEWGPIRLCTEQSHGSWPRHQPCHDSNHWHVPAGELEVLSWRRPPWLLARCTPAMPVFKYPILCAEGRFSPSFHKLKKPAGKKSYRMQHKAEGKKGRS